MKFCTACGTRFSEPVAFCPHDGTPTQELDEAPPPDPLLGRVIDGRYRIERAVGEGGMGIVYLITHAVLGKRMALKVLRGDMARDSDVVQRFMQEAQSATSIGHPNIIDISDFGRLPDGSVYFVMEYLDGQSLTSFISNSGAVPMDIGIHVVRQIASALDGAHARGIVHRDMKPDNIYLVKQGKDPHFVKVLDFGIAKVGGAASKLTKTGMIFGTPHYMSPEQASGQSVDRRTDIYALGVIMYEMFTGKVPFDGDTFMGILSKHMFEQPLPPSQLEGTRTLGAIEEIIMKALAKKPEERYQSMSELIADLDRIAAGAAPSGTRRSSSAIGPPGNLSDALSPPPRTQMHLDPVGPQATLPPDDAPLPTSRAPMIALAIVALAIVGVGVGGVVFWMSGTEPASSTAPIASAGAQGANPQGASPQGASPQGGHLQGASSQGASPQGANPQGASPQGASPQGASPQVTPMGASPGVASTATPGAPSTPTGTLPATVTTPSTPPPRARLVEIASEPLGAEVVIDGAIVGNTPVRLPAPDSGQRVAEVRLRGYETASVMLGETSPETVRVALTPVRTASTTRRTREREPAPPPVIVTTTTPPPPPPRTRPTTEVVDPWAD